jgi:hypothetical protein
LNARSYLVEALCVDLSGNEHTTEEAVTVVAEDNGAVVQVVTLTLD